jgi:hypothetical protein
MPFEIPKYFNAETRSMIEAALDEAWHELSKGTRVEATSTKRRLVRTMVALAAVGETDLMKLKSFAIHAWRGSLQAEKTMTGQRSRIGRTAA